MKQGLNKPSVNDENYDFEQKPFKSLILHQN